MLSEERPYEKCERFGAGSLTDIELLAVLLRTGTKGESALDLARKLFYPGEGTQPQAKAHLQSWTKEELLKISGIGRVKAIQILCLVNFPRECPSFQPEKIWIFQDRIQLQHIIWKICAITGRSI